ncbi:hypothetical protein ADK57_40800 [Streptomyces sp. MMG1533]|uniref:hypothetical protein n=1 Tax=Streptomyces sp. MMG1533 TaxID=1415546 RepID=UPI0006AFFC49|nr:hypothetical protein [Streptomyces sp. MMG1533]KOU56874.1 hypothetical protein ADK57_40800 [Streptomyces sp. MMG1533]
MIKSDYDALVDQGEEAFFRGDAWTASLFYVRAHQLATDRGWRQEAFTALRLAADSWSYTSEPDRGLKLLLEAVHQPRFTGDEKDRYWLQDLFLNHVLYLRVSVDDVDELVDHLSARAMDAWGHEGSNTTYKRARVLIRRGKWAAALEALERAWAQRNDPGPRCWQWQTATLAGRMCLQLARRDEAQRWIAQLRALEDSLGTRWCIARGEADLALFDHDAGRARSAWRRVDALVTPQQPLLPVEATMWAVRALLLDVDEGDPARPAHLARLRLTHETHDPTSACWDQHEWYHLLTCLELAGVRHAAGMLPVEDLHYRRPQSLPRPDDARLPDEVLPRLAAFERACDTALKNAQETDARFDCSWRQDEVAELRRRGRDIAAVFRR